MYRYDARLSSLLCGHTSTGNKFDSLWWRDLVCLGNDCVFEGW